VTDPAAPLRHIEYRRVRDLLAAPVNPKGHDLELIRKSMERFGFIEAVAEDGRTGRIISGHGRQETLALAEAAGLEPPEGIMLDDDGAWTVPVTVGWKSVNDDEAAAALVVVNHAVELGGWEDAPLAGMLAALPSELMELTGFTTDDLERMRASDDDESGPTPPWSKEGQLLKLAQVTLGEPTHKVALHEVWMAGKHVLVVDTLTTGFPLWGPILAELHAQDAAPLFVPYPGPYVAATKAAGEGILVMVQPDHYMAGHVLDRFAEVRSLTPVKVAG
jgi:hypothetical protein